MCVCVCVYVCTYIHIHTYIHTYICLLKIKLKHVTAAPAEVQQDAVGGSAFSEHFDAELTNFVLRA